MVRLDWVLSCAQHGSTHERRQHPPTWGSCAALYTGTGSWLGAKCSSGMAADRACGAGRPLSAGMEVGWEAEAVARAANASGPASGCCPPRPSQGIGPGSVSPWWPPGCLQSAQEGWQGVWEQG